MSEYQRVSSATRKAVVIEGNSKCSFCGRTDDDTLKYGPKYKLGNVRAHYYCVLLSNNLKQNGDDDEGMLGFLLEDIENELMKCSKIKCIYCGNGTASLFCKKKNCRKSFHLPCGQMMGTLHQFKGSYDSYCHRHRLFQSIPKEVLREASDNKVVCCICYDEVPLWNKLNYIWAPCCQKTWYHKKCLQGLALSAGYFFKCATCNDSRKFINCVLKFGIFIPQQDASWELVPNAYNELLFKYEQCDAKICKCPGGRRENSEKTTWEIILCNSCGSQGIHIGCRNSNFNKLWECPGCQEVIEKLNSKKPQNTNAAAKYQKNHLKTQQGIFPKKRCRATEDLENFILDKRKKCKSEVEEEEEEDVEIDVVTVEKSTTANKTNDTIKQSIEVTEVKKTILRQDLEEILASVKPGPLSFKLRMIENYSQVLDAPENSKREIKDFNLKAVDSLTRSDENDRKQFYPPADFNFEIWNDELDNVYIFSDPDLSECSIAEEREIIILDN